MESDAGRTLLGKPFYVYFGPDDQHLITLEDGFRFVIFTIGHAPSVAPISAPGRYEMSPDILPGGQWPIGITTVDLKICPAIESMPAERATELLKFVAAEYASPTGATKYRETWQ